MSQGALHEEFCSFSGNDRDKPWSITLRLHVVTLHIHHVIETCHCGHKYQGTSCLGVVTQHLCLRAIMLREWRKKKYYLICGKCVRHHRWPQVTCTFTTPWSKIIFVIFCYTQRNSSSVIFTHNDNVSIVWWICSVTTCRWSMLEIFGSFGGL